MLFRSTASEIPLWKSEKLVIIKHVSQISTCDGEVEVPDAALGDLVVALNVDPLVEVSTREMPLSSIFFSFDTSHKTYSH